MALVPLRDAIRSLRSAPLIAAAAVLSLALGIGATAAIFSLLNGLLLKPLPVPNPHELVVMTDGADPDGSARLSYPVWRELRDRGALPGAFAWTLFDGLRLGGAGETAVVDAVWATGNYFDALGVPPMLGRTFTPADDRRGAGPGGPVAVISYGFWHQHFDGSADVIGRTLTLEQLPVTVIGVMPEGFSGLDVGTGFDVMLPLETEPLLGRTPPRLDVPTWSWLQVMTRRTSDDTPESLTAAVRAVQPQVRQATMPDFPRADDRDAFLREPWAVRPASSGVSRLRGQYRAAVVALFGVVAFVLLIACTNISTLLLGRATARRHEFAVRLSLGASRGRLFGQLLVESLVLACLGAAMGLLFAHWGGRLLLRQLSTWAYTPTLDVSPDWRVIGASIVLTGVSAILCGAAPAFRAARAAPIDALARAHDSTIERRFGAGATLVIAQLAISLVLIVGAGLFLRSFVALAYRDLGFDREGILIVALDAQRSAAPPDARLALYEQVRQAVAAIPDVDTAALSMATPLASAGIRLTPAITIPGRAMPADGVRVLTNPVSADWFAAFGTRLVAGRPFDARDTPAGTPVVIANEAFVSRYFGGANPIGQTVIDVSARDDPRSLQIVGIVEDAGFVSVRDPIAPTLYAPLAQRVSAERAARFPSISLSVRARSNASNLLARQIASTVADVDDGLVATIQTFEEQLNYFYVRERLLATLSVFFGAFAVILAALGLSASMSYAVSRRRKEIGVRMVVGAKPASVVGMVMSRAAALVLCGVATGAMVSAWLARFIAGLLYEVPGRDPIVFGAACMILASIGAIAAWLPARRASRIDPAAILREALQPAE